MPFVKALEVINVAELARLRHTLATHEPAMAVKSETVIHVLAVAHEKQDGDNSSAGPPFAGVAMDNHHAFFVGCTNFT